LLLLIVSLRDKKKMLNAGMVSMTLQSPHKKAIQQVDSEIAVFITFRHERKAKGPHFSKISHELYPEEEPTAIQGTEKCVYWNSLKG